MGKNMTIAAFAAALGFGAGIYFYGEFGIYSSSEECILANIKNARSSRAAILVSHSCKEMYPEHRQQVSSRNPFDQFDE